MVFTEQVEFALEFVVSVEQVAKLAAFVELVVKQAILEIFVAFSLV